MNVVTVDDAMMKKYGPVAATLAAAEGLTAHARAVGDAYDKARGKKGKGNT
jgi:histidinol dehydrogenase